MPYDVDAVFGLLDLADLGAAATVLLEPGHAGATYELASRQATVLLGGAVEVVLTHGNGPQAGNLLVENELAAAVVPPVPLDWCGAQTQGPLRGRPDERPGRRAVRPGHRPTHRGPGHPDPGGRRRPGPFIPTKPIGRHLPRAEVLVIGTDVAHAVLHWGTPQARDVGTVPVAQMRELAAEGPFAGGSRGPKVDAACRFVEQGGRRAVITDLAHLADAITGDVGTVVVP